MPEIWHSPHTIATHTSCHADSASCDPEMDLSVVVPCFNEENVVPDFSRRMHTACEGCCLTRFEIIFVDDGSSDTTWQVIQSLHRKSEHVVGVRLLRNHGHQLAATAGLAHARGAYVLLIDADLQDPPELLPDMLREARNGADVVYGRRVARQGETAFKKLSAKAFYRVLTRLTDLRIHEDTGDFRLMSRKIVYALREMPERQRFIRGMVSWIGGRQVALPYVRDARLAGTTKYPLRKMIALATDAITGFSAAPLRLALWLSLGGGLFSLSVLAYAVLAWLFGQTVPGWTSIVGTIAIFGSLQLLVLGIIGEYLGRLFVEQKRRPMFLIDQLIRHPLSNGAPVVSARVAEDMEKAPP
jgi:polyisoprenyl-phosphate glycosyltransferase